MLLEGARAKVKAYAEKEREKESQLSFQGEMNNSCSEVASQVGKLRRKVSSALLSGFEVMTFFCWNQYDSFPMFFFHVANFLLAVAGHHTSRFSYEKAGDKCTLDGPPPYGFPQM